MSRGLSTLAAGISPSPTLRVAGLARALREDGRDVVDFSVGEPDFPTPEAAAEAGRRAIAEGRTRYTANEGIRELREAIVDKLRADQGVEYDPADVLVSPGAKASLFLTMLALLDEGDEVVLPAPYWVSYPEQIRMAGAVPRVVDTAPGGGFRLSAEQLESAIGPRTRMVVLNYPSNPTGSVSPRDALAAIAEVAARHDLWIVSDEIYERLTYDGRETPTIAAVSADARARTVVVNGLSKAYAMTGWRIGYAAGPRDVVRAMARIQSHDTSNATSVAQWAGVTALRECGPDVGAMVAAFQARRDRMVDGLNGTPGVTCSRPEGAFYAFPDVRRLLGKRYDGTPVETDEDLAVALLEREAVATVPGSAFGAPGFLRLSFAASEERIDEGLRRIRRALGATPAS